MFTEGLDETAIQWINRGSQVQVEDLHNQSIRSPLAENLTLPRSSLSATVSSNLTPKSPSLPPLKFHSCLLPTRNLAFGFSDRHVGHDHDDDESVASLSCSVVESDDDDYDDDDGERVLDSLNTPIAQCYDEDRLLGFGSGTKVKSMKPSGILRKGLVNENITIQVPNCVSARRFTDGELDFNKCVQKQMTPCGSGSGIGAGGGSVQFRNMSNLSDPVDLATPSAPPIFNGEIDLPYSEGSVTNEVDETTQQQPRSWTSRDSVNCDDGGRSECSIEQKYSNVAERQETASTGDIERQVLPHLQYLNKRAESAQGMPLKKREKYARREDAILHALELEKQIVKKQDKLGTGKTGATLRAKRSRRVYLPAESSESLDYNETLTHVPVSSSQLGGEYLYGSPFA